MIMPRRGGVKHVSKRPRRASRKVQTDYLLRIRRMKWYTRSVLSGLKGLGAGLGRASEDMCQLQFFMTPSRGSSLLELELLTSMGGPRVSPGGYEGD